MNARDLGAGKFPHESFVTINMLENYPTHDSAMVHYLRQMGGLLPDLEGSARLRRLVRIKQRLHWLPTVLLAKLPPLGDGQVESVQAGVIKYTLLESGVSYELRSRTVVSVVAGAFRMGAGAVLLPGFSLVIPADTLEHRVVALTEGEVHEGPYQVRRLMWHVHPPP